MLDGVYVDAKEERRIVALKPKPAFKALFDIATTKEGSGVILYNEKTPALSGSPDDLCSWWRRGRVGCSLLETNFGGQIAGSTVRAKAEGHKPATLDIPLWSRSHVLPQGQNIQYQLDIPG